MTRDQPGPARRTAAATSRETDSCSVPELTEVTARLQGAAGLPDLLLASFEAFEIVRLVARRHEDQAAELLPTFMTAADAAVDGRESVTTAPSLARASRTHTTQGALAAQADMTEVTGGLAVLAALLAGRLSDAATLAAKAADRTACQSAARAAQQISGLMARGDDDRLPG
jgi:hypothetical protein